MFIFVNIIFYYFYFNFYTEINPTDNNYNFSFFDGYL